MSNPTTPTRWKLVLGSTADAANSVPMPPEYERMGDVLTALYDSAQAERKAGLGGSAPRVRGWLGDIREYFPTEFVAIMQQDAMTRLGLNQLPLEPEILRTVQADVRLVGTLMSLSRAMLQKAKATAREVISKVVRELEKSSATHCARPCRGL